MYGACSSDFGMTRTDASHNRPHACSHCFETATAKMLLRAHNRLYTLCHFLPGSIVVNIQRHYTVPTRSVSKLLRTQTPITYVLLHTSLCIASLPRAAPHFYTHIPSQLLSSTYVLSSYSCYWISTSSPLSSRSTTRTPANGT
jgi:hypothetical protein